MTPGRLRTRQGRSRQIISLERTGAFTLAYVAILVVVLGDICRAAHEYEPTREAAMAAFAKSWRR
jgi:hypothetical protein